MAFYGCEFVFDEIPCSEYGLMVYNFASNGQGDASFSVGEMVEDRIAGRYDALTYGLQRNQPQEYTLVFGPNIMSVDMDEPLDRYEVEAIATWLTGHQKRKWLTIVQPDMESFRYKCYISDLTLITYGEMPWAFSCTVSCDSPFAYTYPEEYEGALTVAGDQLVIRNRSSHHGYYKPRMEIESSGSDICIVNHSDGDREFIFTDLPSGTIRIDLDNHNQVITNDAGVNLYDKFNMNFMRLVRGDNVLSLFGDGVVRFICEFPVNIGG